MNILEVHNLKIMVEDNIILENVNLELSEKRNYVMFGPNGSGKTTLINTIMGLPHYKIASGKIYFLGKDITKKVSMAKWWIGEMANRVAYNCVQLHGGYGYMEEYEICKWYRDVRGSTIWAGTTEIMKNILGKMLEL